MKKIEGWHWPDDTPENVIDYMIRHERYATPALEYCRPEASALQAGGNIGIYPKVLSTYFSKVFTFEPDLLAFECMQENLKGIENIQMQQYALDYGIGTACLKREKNGSAWLVRAEATDYPDTPYKTIDWAVNNLPMGEVGLIMLDIEGREFFALMGAVDTIRRFKPIIQIEENKTVFKHGLRGTECQDLLTELGYKRAEQAGNDWIYVSQ